MSPTFGTHGLGGSKRLTAPDTKLPEIQVRLISQTGVLVHLLDLQKLSEDHDMVSCHSESRFSLLKAICCTNTRTCGLWAGC